MDISETPPESLSADLIRVSVNISTAWRDKQSTIGYEDHTRSFKLRRDIRLHDLESAILAGHKWTPAAFQDGTRRADTFLSGQLLVIDVDAGGHTLEALQAHPIIGRAWLIHATPSYTVDAPRWRVVFVMPQPIDDLASYKAARAGLVLKVGTLEGVDGMSRTVSQPFAGSTIAAAPGLMHRVDNILTQAEVAELIEAGTPPPAPAIEGVNIHSDAWDEFTRAIEAELARRAGRPLRYTAAGFSQALACVSKRHEHDDVRPAGTWNAVSKSFTCAKCDGETLNAKDTGAALGITYAPAPRSTGAPRRIKGERSKGREKSTAVANVQKRQPVDVAAKILTGGAFTRNLIVTDTLTGRPIDQIRLHTINAPYFAPEHIPADARLVVLVGDKGTGKTEAVSRWRAGRSLLAVSPLIRLVNNTAQRLGLISYRDGIDGKKWNDAQLRQLATSEGLAICAPSLRRLIKNGQVHAPDLVFIDEWTQVVDALAGSMLDDSDARPAQKAFTALLADSARRFVLADADTDADALRVLLGLLPAGVVVDVVYNTYARPRGDLTVYEHSATAFGAGLADLEAGKFVAFACLSALKAQTFAALLTDGKWRVLLLTRETASGAEQSAFLSALETGNVDAQTAILRQYDAVVYSPVMGSGIDIQSPIDSLIAVGTHSPRKPIHPAQFGQLIDRFRVVGHTHIYAQPASGRLETNPRMIDDRMSKRADRVGRDADYLEHVDWTHTTVRMAARRNTAVNNFRAIVGRNLAGYAQVETNDQPQRDINERLREQKADREAYARARTFELEPIDPMEHAKRKKAGKLTDDDDLALTRWHIETMAGVSINTRPDLYDRLARKDQRRRCESMIAIMCDDDGILRQKYDADDRHRAYAAIRANAHRLGILRRVMIALAGSVEAFDEKARTGQPLISDDAEETRLASALDANGAAPDEMPTYVDDRPDLSMRPMARLKRLMARVGVKINQERHKGVRPPDEKGDTRGWVYTVDAASWAEASTLADLCAGQVLRAAAEKIGATTFTFRTNDIAQHVKLVGPADPVKTPAHAARRSTTGAGAAAIAPMFAGIGG